MASLRRLFYIPLRSTLPRLRHHLTSGRQLDEHDEGVDMLLGAGLMRDWSRARRVVKTSKKTPETIFWELSKKYRPNWKRRLRFWAIGLIGGYTYDPHLKELKELEQRREK